MDLSVSWESLAQQAVGQTGQLILSTLSAEAGPLCRNERRKEGRKSDFSYFIIIGLGITIDALAKKGRNALIKITDDRKLGDINKEDVHSNTQEKLDALGDWDIKNGRKCMSKNRSIFRVIGGEGSGGTLLERENGSS